MGEDDGAVDGAVDGRRWSEFLLPAVQGAIAEEESQMTGDNDGRYDEAGDEDFEEDNEEDEEGSMRSLQSHVSFASLPSYMRSKSGMEMDPDRVSLMSSLLVAPHHCCTVRQ